MGYRDPPGQNNLLLAKPSVKRTNQAPVGAKKGNASLIVFLSLPALIPTKRSVARLSFFRKRMRQNLGRLRASANGARRRSFPVRPLRAAPAHELIGAGHSDSLSSGDKLESHGMPDG